MKSRQTTVALACSFVFFTSLPGKPALGQTPTPTPFWTKAAPMPGASSRLQAAFVGGKLYAISGYATNRVGIYDPANNSWTTGAPLPPDTSGDRPRNLFLEKFGRAVVPRSGSTPAKIYVIGGDDRFDMNPNPRNTNYIYTPAYDTWDTGVPMPTARSGVAAVNLELNGTSKIYVIGGKDRQGKASTRVDIYDPNAVPPTDPWSPGTDLPEARAGVAAGAINEKIYVFGGYDASGKNLKTGLVFDPNKPDLGWQRAKTMPIIPGAVHSTVVKGKLFLVGCGIDPVDPNMQVLVYNPADNPPLGKWKTYPLLPMGSGRPDGGVASDGVSQLYYVGGGKNAPLDELDILSFSEGFDPNPFKPVITNPTDLDILSTNEAFNPATNTWTSGVSVARMPTARAAFGIAEAGGKIYVGGGQVIRDCSSAVNNLEAYDPPSNSWTTLPPMPTARMHLALQA